MKVLLIDDSAIMRMMVKSLLKQVGLTDIVEAGNGIEGIAAIGNETIDLVFLDLHMPQMDGLEFLKQLRAKPEYANLPVIVLSSDAEQSQVEVARRLGANSYITKPFRIDGLRAAMQEALRE
jgi:two-component system, chemotaxis family, chemotaxis protein CheY